MGSGIATALILSNYPVVLKEVNENFLQAGIGRVKGEYNFLFIPFYYCFQVNVMKILNLYLISSANLQSRVKKGKMTQEKYEKTFSLLKGTLDYESFRDVDMVIEVPENKLLKS